MSTPASRRAKPSRADIPAALLIFLLGLATWSVAEDAYITFRYAWNWAHGHGVVFNVGLGRPVEGFSNFLWLVLAALFEVVGLAPEVFVPAVSLLCAVVLVWQVRAVAEEHFGASQPAAIGAAIATACFAPAVHWATSGLEPMPQTLLMFTAAVGLAFEDRAKRGWWIGLAALGLALIRTEGIAWVPVMMALGAAVRWREGRPVLPIMWRTAVVVAVGYGAFLAWKVPYYGGWLSNVAVAKVSFGPIIFWRGVRYVATFVLVLLWPVIVPVGWAQHARQNPTRTAWLALLTTGIFVYPVVVGGDYMGHFRFLVPITPFVGLGLALTLEAAAQRWGQRAMVLTAVTVSLVGFAPLYDGILVPQAVLRHLDYSTPVGGEGREDVVFRRGKFLIPNTVRFLEERAIALQAFLKPGDVMVTAAIGKTGYRNPEVAFLDLCGLVDRDVARREVVVTTDMRPGHEKCIGPSYFLSRKPDVLTFDATYGRKAPGEIRTKVKMWRRKYPEGRYAPDLVIVRGEVPGGWVFGYGLRLVKDSDKARALWDAFDARLDRLEERANNYERPPNFDED